jgi:hypothetical protein
MIPSEDVAMVDLEGVAPSATAPIIKNLASVSRASNALTTQRLRQLAAHFGVAIPAGASVRDMWQLLREPKVLQTDARASVCALPDGRLASAGLDRMVRVWDHARA